MENLDFDHIAVATNSIEATLKEYEKLGYSLDGDFYKDNDQGVTVCFLVKHNAPRIELVEGLNSESPINNIVKKSGVGPYHMCYRTLDFEATIAKLEQMNYIRIGKVTIGAAFGTQICFLYNVRIGLIEIVESAND